MSERRTEKPGASRSKPSAGRRRRKSTVRRGRGWVRGVGAVSLGVVLTIGVVETARWASASERFAIRTIDVTGAERADPEALRALSGIADGDNLFWLDLAEASARVANHPWVARAEVRLLTLNRVRIEVVEHEPVAVVALGNLYFTDRDGRIFKRYSPGEVVALPVITGLDRTRIEADDPGETELLARGLELVLAWQPSAYGLLAEVNVHEARGLTAVVGEEGASVVVGHGDWSGRLARLPIVWAALEARGLKAHRIDLSGRRQAARAVVVLEPDEQSSNGDV